MECEECRAIRRELQAAYEAAKGRLSREQHEAPDLSAWIQDLNEECNGRLRDMSTFWTAWRRWKQHHALTGHAMPMVSLPPEALISPN